MPRSVMKELAYTLAYAATKHWPEQERHEFQNMMAYRAWPELEPEDDPEED